MNIAMVMIVFLSVSVALATQKPLKRKPAQAAPQPAPQVAPQEAAQAAPKPTSRPRAKENHGLEINILPSYSFTRIDAEDTADGSQGTFLTKYNGGLNLEGKTGISSRVYLKLGVNSNYVSFSAPASTAYESPEKIVYGLFVGAGGKLDEKKSIEVLISREKDFFIRALSPRRFSIDDVFINKLRVNLFYTTSKWSQSELKLLFSGHGTLPSQTDYGYKTKIGYGGQGGFVYSSNFKNLKLEPQVSYRYSVKDTELFKQRQQDVVFALGVLWNF